MASSHGPGVTRHDDSILGLRLDKGGNQLSKNAARPIQGKPFPVLLLAACPYASSHTLLLPMLCSLLVIVQRCHD
jgi:hypothetical protein